LKILVISPTQSGIGGIAQNVQGLTKFLKKKGHHVDIISSENTFTIPIKGLKNPSFMISSFFKTKLKKNYDIVHAQNIPSALAMKNVSGKKVLSLWGMFSEQIQFLHGNSVGKFASKFEKNALSWADAITVPSKEIYEHYSKKSSKIHYIPNAIDLDLLPLKEEKKYPQQIIFAGRLSKEKGIFDLIIFAEKLPKEINLLILGSGPEEKKIKKISENIKNVHYLGYQPKEITIPLIRGSDILIQPSLIEGGLNTTLLEAMACKTPIIATSLDVYKNEIRHLDTAYCVRPSSPDDILAGTKELLSNKQKSKEISENAYKIAQNHSWNKIGEEFLQLYNQLLTE